MSVHADCIQITDQKQAILWVLYLLLLLEYYFKKTENSSS